MTAVFVAALVALVPLGVGTQPSLPPSCGVGGPDDYGYRFIDSDTTCPGAPTYNWVDIKGIGTQITGLGDDNIVGPFDVGFDFPYYWYRVNQFYVGSNGYIAFHDNTMAAHPFQHIPSTQRPNNLLAPLMCDMDCSVGGSVWYWSNADTCIVQYDSTKFWNTGGCNTFQIILSRPDSTVTFQYKEQAGTPMNGWNPDMNQTGIDNVTGNIGLQYLGGTTPTQNMYHAELAVLFIPPESTSYEVHNSGILNAMNDRSGGLFLLNNEPLTFWAMVSNSGNQPETDFWTYVQVTKLGAPMQFSDSILTSVPSPGDVDSVVLPATWTPTQTGTYTITFYTRMAGDMVPGDDSVDVELNVVTIPGTLSYDKGVPDGIAGWSGPGGYGCRFVPPVYPCEITGIKFFGGPGSYTQCAMGLFDDNGPAGSPGDTLFITHVDVNAQDWFSADLPSPYRIDEGAFFVGAMSAATGSPLFGYDSTLPSSRQGWEFTGTWARSRHPDWDMLFNATIAYAGIKSELDPAPARGPVRVVANPNPFSATCRLRLSASTPCRTIEVYDATGTLVCTRPVVKGTAALDGRALPGGVYFARLQDTESPVTKLVICHEL